MATTTYVGLRDIVSAVADELQLSDECVSVNQITIMVTCSIEQQEEDVDWIDDWYQSYVSGMDGKEEL